MTEDSHAYSETIDIVDKAFARWDEHYGVRWVGRNYIASAVGRLLASLGGDQITFFHEALSSAEDYYRDLISRPESDEFKEFCATFHEELIGVVQSPNPEHIKGYYTASATNAVKKRLKREHTSANTKLAVLIDCPLEGEKVVRAPTDGHILQSLEWNPNDYYTRELAKDRSLIKIATSREVAKDKGHHPSSLPRAGSGRWVLTDKGREAMAKNLTASSPQPAVLNIEKQITERIGRDELILALLNWDELTPRENLALDALVYVVRVDPYHGCKTDAGMICGMSISTLTHALARVRDKVRADKGMSDQVSDFHSGYRWKKDGAYKGNDMASFSEHYWKRLKLTHEQVKSRHASAHPKVPVWSEKMSLKTFSKISSINFPFGLSHGLNICRGCKGAARHHAPVF